VRQALPLIGWMAACMAAGWLGSMVTVPAIDTWYARLAKPSWTPPGSLFGPVWTALYLAMAVAAWLVSRKAGLTSPPIRWFVLQLALNAAWSWLFFGLRRPDIAFVDIVLLWSAILATMIAFRPWSMTAFLLLTPYLAWVSFATALNFAIWRLNPPGGSS
jgi:translocator protein